MFHLPFLFSPLFLQGQEHLKADSFFFFFWKQILNEKVIELRKLQEATLTERCMVLLLSQQICEHKPKKREKFKTNVLNNYFQICTGEIKHYMQNGCGANQQKLKGKISKWTNRRTQKWIFSFLCLQNSVFVRVPQRNRLQTFIIGIGSHTQERLKGSTPHATCKLESRKVSCIIQSEFKNLRTRGIAEAKGLRPGTTMSQGRKRWLFQLEETERKNLLFLEFLLYLCPQQTGWCLPTMVRADLFYSVQFKGWFSLVLTDILRNVLLTIWVSLRPIRLTCKTNHHK